MLPAAFASRAGADSREKDQARNPDRGSDAGGLPGVVCVIYTQPLPEGD